MNLNPFLIREELDEKKNLMSSFAIEMKFKKEPSTITQKNLDFVNIIEEE
jgi:hypothetical protein